MPRPSDGPDARQAANFPVYLLHGEDRFQAQEFIDGLRRVLAKTGAESPNLERFSLEDTPWRDVLDVARMMPFLFSPWRILVVEADGRHEELSAAEAARLGDYFAAPTPRTTLVVLFEGKIRKTKDLAKVFDTAPASSVDIREFTALKGDRLKSWVIARFAAFGKSVTSEAVDRLLDLVDNDLARLGSEVEKLALYAGENRLIDAEAVERLAGGIKIAMMWELTAALEKQNPEKAVAILHRIFAEGEKEKTVLGVLGLFAGFFRDLFLAKSQAGDRSRSRERIYAELKPKFVKACQRFPFKECEDFFALAERKDLPKFLADLERIDLVLKTTDSSPQALFEALIWDFCRETAAAEVTSRGGERFFPPGG
jgi:DNA polymerase-3 subunit delta